MEDITDADYKHPKRVCKAFEVSNLAKYHDLYLKSDTLLLAYIFENIRKMGLEIRPCKIYFSSRISLASSFEKDCSKIRIINWYWYAINRYEKANNKWHIIMRIKNHHIQNNGM